FQPDWIVVPAEGLIVVTVPQSSGSEGGASQLERLPSSDITPLLRLMGELAVVRGDPRRWRLALLTALNQLLPAAASAAFVAKPVTSQPQPVVVSIFDAGMKVESRREAFLREFNVAPFRDPFT